MSKHPKTLEGISLSLETLASSIGHLSYDQTSVFIKALADDIQKQADADAVKGREKLSTELYATAKRLYEAKEKMDLAWEICKPYMKN